MKRALIYLRVSTERQARRGGSAEGFSIPAQRSACHRKAEALGAEVVDEYTDAGESARSADRDGLQAMLSRLQLGDVDYVIVHKLDRLARNRRDDVEIAFQIKQSGAQLISCTENIDETPSGVLLHSIMAGIAEFYSKNLGAEVKKGLHQKARNGGTPSQAPIGYLNHTERIEGQDIKTIIVDEDRAGHITWAFETYAGGDYSLTELTKELAGRGLKGRVTRKRPGKPMSRSQVHRMLSNPYYIGIIDYGGSEYEGNHPPIVDMATWQTVQRVLAEARQAKERPQRHKHYLIGTLYCGHCGARMGLTNSRGKLGEVYPYFFCLGKNKKRTNCTQGYVAVEDIETAVESYYRNVDLDHDELGHIREGMTSHIGLMAKLNKKEVQRQERRIQSLDQERRKLLQMAYAEALPLDLLREEQRRITDETAQAERIKTACEGQYERIQKNLDRALKILDDVHADYLARNDDGRRSLNQALWEKLFVVDGMIAGGDLAAPYRQLTQDDLDQAIEDEQATPAEELFTEAETHRVRYERTKDQPPLMTDQELAQLLSTVDWHPRERPKGPLPMDIKNPVAYCSRGSNKTLLAEEVGFEPTDPCRSHAFQAWISWVWRAVRRRIERVRRYTVPCGDRRNWR